MESRTEHRKIWQGENKNIDQAAVGDKDPVAWDPDFYDTITHLPISFVHKGIRHTGRCGAL